MMRLLLTGVSATGKSTVIAALAARGHRAIDLDHVVLPHAPPDAIAERLTSRTTDTHGKSPRERARVLAHVDTVEQRLRERATSEIDTSLPLEGVLAAVAGLIEEAE